tara:strand:+ start:333 stop:497 length:165 start_codon:yes stop_codon:yes gene_type:complete
MKIKIKTKVVVRVLLIFWACFFIFWFFILKDSPEFSGKRVVIDLKQNFQQKENL